jgi:hypothetical protein
MFYFSKGINKGFLDLGDFLLKRYKKKRYDPNEFDLMRSTIGYMSNTGNFIIKIGGFYWYNVDLNTTNYENIFLDLKKYHKEIKLPIRYYELDSWWYPKFNDSYNRGGIKKYEPNPKLLPNGFRYLRMKLDTPLATHSRYYSSDNVYQNEYKFLHQPKASIPLQVEYFNMKFAQLKSWGVTHLIYDWLESIYEFMPIVATDVSTARNYLLNMNNAALNNDLSISIININIVLCMPTVNFYFNKGIRYYY